MLRIENTVFLLVDVQGNLAQAMYDREALFANLQRLIRGALALDLPILWVEQYPQGLGPTVPELAALLPGRQPIAKTSFSCCGNEAFLQALAATRRWQVLLAGIEAHVCIYQTTIDLLARGYHVEVVADAVSSRTAQNREIGLRRVQAAGAAITSVEMALFELQRVAEGPRFRELLRIVR